MLKIRLKRLGRKRQPHYRIVVSNSTSRRDGAPVEELGYYEPKRKNLRLDKAKALDWIKKGAQPTETVKALIENSTDEGNLKPEVIEARKQRKAELKIKKAQKVTDDAKAAATA